MSDGTSYVGLMAFALLWEIETYRLNLDTNQGGEPEILNVALICIST